MYAKYCIRKILGANTSCAVLLVIEFTAIKKFRGWILTARRQISIHVPVPRDRTGYPDPLKNPIKVRLYSTRCN